MLLAMTKVGPCLFLHLSFFVFFLDTTDIHDVIASESKNKDMLGNTNRSTGLDNNIGQSANGPRFAIWTDFFPQRLH